MTKKAECCNNVYRFKIKKGENRRPSCPVCSRVLSYQDSKLHSVTEKQPEYYYR